MPWRLDHIGGQGANPTEFGFEEGQDRSVVLRLRGAIPDQAHLPIRITQNSKHKTLPDFTVGPTTGNLLVSQKFRERVEAWDSVEHTFIPVTLRRPDGEVWVDRYFFFEPLAPIDNGIVVDESDVKAVLRRGEVSHYRSTAQRPRLMWRRSAVGDRHLWNDPHLPRAIVVSDAFYADLKEHGVVGFQAHEARFSEDETSLS